MRNIVQIDFNDVNNCGVLNSAYSESSILLCITPEARQKTSLKVEITGSNGEVLTSPELAAAGGIVRCEADREYWTEAGTMKVRLLSGEGNSGYAEFQIIEDMSGGNAQVKQIATKERMFSIIASGKERSGQEVLYENSNGITADIKLKDDAGNYEYIEIYFGYGNGIYGGNTTKVYYPHQKTANMILSIYDNLNCQMMMTTVEISGTEIKTIEYGLVDVLKHDTYRTKYIRIYRVLGYR